MPGLAAPRSELLAKSEPLRVQIIIDELSAEIQQELRYYLGMCTLGLVGISGFVGSGKTHMLVLYQK